MLENLKIIMQRYKMVSIVTNHIGKFKKMENEILEKYGIMITVGNNKKKSLAKSKIILNVDFPAELVNSYNIYEEAIIINLKNKVKINKKRFNGLSINDYEISFENIDILDYEKFSLFDKKDLYEAMIYQKQPFSNIMNKIKKDKVEIERLYGSNTVI